ncbi:hypothetical protein BHM03_00029713 [Ensete ventricosum]|nr:hypothetical protein BHM03_00029713 [Ensete ventricosum]
MHLGPAVTSTLPLRLSIPCGRRCYLRAAPRAGAAPADGRSCLRSPMQAAAQAAGLPLVALQRAAATCGLAAGGCPLRSRRGQQPLAGWSQSFVPARLLPLRVAAPCRGPGRGHARLPLARASFAAKTQQERIGVAIKIAKTDKTTMCERLILPREIVYPCIPDPDGEDEGGQASSSLAVSTRWISAAKLLQSDLVTLWQREGGE